MHVARKLKTDYHKKTMGNFLQFGIIATIILGNDWVHMGMYTRLLVISDRLFFGKAVFWIIMLYFLESSHRLASWECGAWVMPGL